MYINKSFQDTYTLKSVGYKAFSNHVTFWIAMRSGVTVYTFIDDRHSLFYSTVISASEREAAYVIDGLLHNNVIKSDIHSTDMHGFTETIFAATHFIGTSFAPRFKNINRQCICADMQGYGDFAKDIQGRL